MTSLKIKWAVIQVDGSITKSIFKQLKRVDFSVAVWGSTVLSHSGNNEKCKERTEKLLDVLKKNERSGKVFVITDAQFGRSVNSFDGVAKFYQPFKRHIVVSHSNCVTTIPVTSKQVSEATKF